MADIKQDCHFSAYNNTLISPEMYERAHIAGFSVESHDSFVGTFTLEKDEIALCCMRCDNYKIINRNGVDSIDELTYIRCNDDCGQNQSKPEITRIINHEMAWCVDYRYCLDYIVRETLGNFNDPVAKKASQTYIDDAYYVCHPHEKYTFECFCPLRESGKGSPVVGGIFIRLFQNSISSKGSLTFLEADETTYFENIIRENIAYFDSSNSPSDAMLLEVTCNGYIQIENSLSNEVAEHPELFISSDKNYVNKQQAKMDNFMKTHRCPVCRRYYEPGETLCSYCKFPELGHVFLNQADGEIWYNNVVIPARRQVKIDWERVYNSVAYLRFLS